MPTYQITNGSAANVSAKDTSDAMSAPYGFAAGETRTLSLNDREAAVLEAQFDYLVATYPGFVYEKVGNIETEHYQDTQATGVVAHLRDDDGGAGRAAGAVLAVAFSGIQPDQARSLRVVTVGMGAVANRKVTVTGKVRSKTTTEDIAIPTAAATVEALKPFESITSVDYPAVPIGGSISLELSNKLGLERALKAAADVLKVNKNGLDIAIGTIDVTNGTVAQTIGAGDDFKIFYKGK